MGSARLGGGEQGFSSKLIMGVAMGKTLSDSDIALLQEFNRCLQELNYARGANKISLIVYEIELKSRLEQRGLLELVK